MLGKAYTKTTKKSLPFWFLEEHDLAKYQTSKKHAKKNINKIPKSPPTYMVYDNKTSYEHELFLPNPFEK